MAKLEKSQQYWNQMADADSMWAVLSDDSKFGRKWNPQEFFDLGVREIDGILEDLHREGIAVNTSRALDFGCGLGRLTQALARHFDEVVGVDIAPSMLEQARSFNRFGDRCRYLINATDDLSQFADGTFSFVYSMVVLQHIRQPHSLNYLREFARVAAPGAVLAFQIPEIDRRNVAGAAVRGIRRAINTSPFLVRLYLSLAYRSSPKDVLREMPSALMDVEPIDRTVVARVLSEGGVRVVKTQDLPDRRLGMQSLLYFAVKDAPPAP